MTKEEILEELTKVNVNHLNEETKLLFDTIMSEFDKRDNYKQALNEIREYIYNHELVDSHHEYVVDGNYILQIIVKTLGDDEK